MRKETLVFLTSLAIIFIIGYINMTMTPENIFSEEDYAQLQDEISSEDSSSDLSQILENSSEEISGAELVEVMEQTDTTDIAMSSDESEEPEVPNESDSEASIAEVVEEESDYVILGDITDILLDDDDSVTASSEGIFDMLNSSFANFKLNKDKKNMDVIDHLEESISNESISDETKSQFEALLLNKNDFVEKENNIELMLQSKGYNETAVIVDSDTVKVVTNDKIEQADATKILDVIVSETNYEPEQIKIVKFDNIDL